VILADTSVLIDFFKGKHNAAVDKLEQAIAANVPFGITVFIYQEILQGAATEKEFNHLKRYLDTQPQKCTAHAVKPALP
jgi:predicted nucleic acid-binding protein